MDQRTMKPATTTTPTGPWRPVWLKDRTWALRDAIGQAPEGAPLFHTRAAAERWLAQ